MDKSGIREIEEQFFVMLRELSQKIRILLGLLQGLKNGKGLGLILLSGQW